MANRCKTVEGSQQCIRAARHPKVKGHTLGPKGETKEWNADGTPKAKATPDIAEEERRRLAFEKAPAWAIAAGWDNPDDTGELPRRDAAWFDPSPDAPTVTIPTVKPNSQPRPAVLSGADLMLAEVDQTADEAIRQMGDRYLLDLMVEEFDHEVAQTERLMGQLEDEVYDRVRFLDFADAANVAGHHPAAAYCYAADRFDPAVVA